MSEPRWGRYDALVSATIRAVTRLPGHTSPRVREALVNREVERAPEEFHALAGLIRDQAHRITDEDVERARHAGLGDDHIFELTTATALGEALRRLDRGLAALRDRAT